MGRLTDQVVKQAKPKALAYEEPDGQDGLRLVIYPSGKKSWAVRYRNAAGKLRKVTLGPIERTGLKDARKWAKALMVEIQAGHDPAAKEPLASGGDSVTVAKAFTRFMVARRAQERNRAADEVQRQYKAYIEPALGQRILREVTGDEARKPVLALLDAGSRIMANRLHATLTRFFKWCADEDQKLIDANPYAGRKRPADERKRDRVLSSKELASVWQAAGDADQPFGPMVRLMILTAQRRSEVAGLTDRELDLNRREWVIPSERAKNGDRHVVSLNDPALSELASVKRVKGKAGYIFTTDGKAAFCGFSKAKAKLDEGLGFSEGWRLHDLRRTAATGMAALGVPASVVEAILNHRTGTRSGVSGIYNVFSYAGPAELALRAWGRYVVDVVAVEPRRLIWDAMRAQERAAACDAIGADDDTWSAYIAAALDAPEAPEAADDAGEPEVLEVAA